MGIFSDRISRRLLRIWQRNFSIYRKRWKIRFIPPLLEPLFYLAAFGVGLSSLMGTIPHHGSQISYVSFIAPALLAITVMYSAFFETTYDSYVRMFYQKTYDAILATPLSVEEIITGEILWGATKSVIAAAIMMVVIGLFGLLRFPSSLLILVLAFVGGFAFGAVGMFFTGIVRDIETFNLPIFLLITPMFLFSGTFFPIEALPAWAQYVAHALPLTNLTEVIRSLSYGEFGTAMLWQCGYLVLFSAVFFPLAIMKMRKRLIK
jgi:lipooligosaccharide transport system permease protein